MGHRTRLKDNDVGKGAMRAWERVLQEHSHLIHQK